MNRSGHPSPEPSPARTASRYDVFRELASGGMASVFYARLLGPSGFSRTVAVKRPHPQIATDRDFARMFIDEARVASRIHHPNVVATLDVIETPDELGLVMEYVHGESLSRLWVSARERNEPIPIAIAAAILLDVLHGLQAAHEATDQDGQPLGIVHRDVSPQNVLVGADGITRIVDFGIAKAKGRLHTTRDGAVKGKYAYMAPEQFRGDAVDGRADVYAASIVFWELLTGESLFKGTSAGEEVYKSMEAVVPAPSTLDGEIPAALDAIVLRGLDRDPEKRFPTARAMAIEIERVAPAVRPSEIASWVWHLAGEGLAERAAIVAEMDGSGRQLGDLPSDSSRPSGRSTANDSQRTNAGVVAESMSRALVPRTRASRLLAGVALLAVLVAGTFGARSFGWGATRAPALEGAPQAAEDVPPAAAASATTESTPPSPVASATVLTSALAPALAPALASVDASAPAAVVSPKRPGHGAKGDSCDPPYTVDSAGRRIFKLRCL